MPRAKLTKWYAGACFVEDVTFTCEEQGGILERLDLEDEVGSPSAEQILMEIAQVVKLYQVDVCVQEEHPSSAAIEAELKPFREALEVLYLFPSLSSPAREALCSAWSDEMCPGKYYAHVREALRDLDKNIKVLVVAAEGARRDLEKRESRGRSRKIALPNLLKRLLQIFEQHYAQSSPTWDAYDDFARYVLKVAQLPAPAANLTRKIYRSTASNK